MKKAGIAIAMMAALSILIAGCSSQKNETETTSGVSETQSIEQTADTTANADTTVQESTSAAESTTTSADAALTYEMSQYTVAPNEKSSVKILYPKFVGKGSEELNEKIMSKVKSFATIDTSVFSADEALTVDFDAKVTLQNDKIVSMIFWGNSSLETSAYPTTNLYALNIDLNTGKQLALKELYKIDSDFSKIFFEKAKFPSEPETSYNAASFAEMLKLQENAFDTPDAIDFFLKPDGIVLSMSAVHATGSDHFEAQLSYADIQQFNISSQSYWEA